MVTKGTKLRGRREYMECCCGAGEHRLAFTLQWYDDPGSEPWDAPELDVEVYLDPEVAWYKRIWRALNYVVARRKDCNFVWLEWCGGLDKDWNGPQASRLIDLFTQYEAERAKWQAVMDADIAVIKEKRGD